MARPIKLFSFIVLAFIAAGLLLSPRIGVARPIPTSKAFVIRDGEQHGCRAEDLDAAPFAAPSKERRWGSVVVGCYEHGRAQLEEWDLYAGRVLGVVKLPTPPGDNQIRVAHGAGHVVVVLAEAMEGGGNARVLLLDDGFRLQKTWDIKGRADFANIAADGSLAVVIVRGGHGARVMTLDLSRGRVIARREFSRRGESFAPYDRPDEGVRVHGKDIFLGLHDESTLRLLRLDRNLETRALHAWHPRMGGTSGYWLALDRGQPVLQVGGRIYALHRGLGHATLLRSARTQGQFHDYARWAISPGGRVATEDGRIASGRRAPFVRALRYTNQVVVRGMKREILANATRYVFWAFGRAVIVRSAWNVGVTAIQPR